VGDDGEFEALYALGARSFAIWTVDGTQIFESGDQFEQSTAALLPDFFNADKDENAFDKQSRNQGPQPEGIAIAEVDGTKLAITGLEDIGGLQVYDVTKPGESAFLGYFTTRDFSNGPDGPAAGDLSPEGVTSISAEDSPTGRPLVAAGFETSGSTVLYEFKSGTPIGTNDVDLMAGDDSQDVLIGLAGDDFLFGHGGDDKLFGGLNDDRMRGGEGDDFMLGQAGKDLLLGDQGDDVLLGNQGDDILKGGDGEDIAHGGLGDDELYGGAGDDIIDGDAGDDLAFGSQGDDRVEGGLGDDILIGGSSDDLLAGGFGLDVAIFAGLFADFRITGRNALMRDVHDLTGDEGDDTLSLVEILQFEDGFLDARDDSFTEGYANERVEALMTGDNFSTDPESPLAVEVASITQGETLVIEGDSIA
jgi:Ca2+-binding RTX toxin-like protein